VAIANNGATLLAADGNIGYLYVSTNSGATWSVITSAGRAYWMAVASSSDGTHMAAATYGGYIWTSTNSGSTWSTNSSSSGSANWEQLKSDASGKYLAAQINNGALYTSTNYGSTWTKQTGWTGSGDHSNSLAMDSTGQYLAIGGFFDYMYTSNDYGVTWTKETSPGVSAYYNGATLMTGASGARIAAIMQATNFYISANSGNSFSTINPHTNTLTMSMASAIDFSRFILGSNALAYSSDGGTTWVQTGGYQSAGFGAVAMIPTGTSVIASASSATYSGYSIGGPLFLGTCP
jgi:photosystem II stability/assembly factor-like uncharacterized protein